MSSNNSSISLPPGLPFVIYSKPYSYVAIILALFGMFGNANIIIATLRAKTLKYKCNYLIFINAAFDFYTGIGFLQLNGYILLDESMMPNNVCFNRLSHMVFSMCVGAFLIWTIGLDRLLAIRFATRYHKWETKIYIFLMVLPAVVYSAILTAIGFKSSSAEDMVLLCMPPTAFNGLAFNVWIFSGVVINVLVIITYSAVFFFVRKQARMTNGSRQITEGGFDPMRRLTESLLVIMVVYILGWLITMTVLLLVSTISLKPTIAFHMMLYVGWNATIGVGCNYYIYFMRSADYAQLFRQQLCFWDNNAIILRQSKVSAISVKNAWSTQRAIETAISHRNSIAHVSYDG